jgi:peptidyl-prolyl cis-trans isomerase D
MFDLFRSRDKAVRILLGAILAVVALSMVTYLIPGGPTMGSGGGDTNIAKVGDQNVTMLEAQKAVQNGLRGANLPAAYYSVYAPRIIDSLINDRALAYEARRQGFRISDEDINVAVQNQLPPGYFADGKLVKKAELEAGLAAQGMTVADLRDEIGRQLLVSRFRSIALEGTVVSPQEIEQAYREKNDKVKIEYVILTQSKFESQVKTDDAAIKQYYEKNQRMFQTPAKKSFAYLVFDPNQVGSTIQVTDGDLLKEYNSNLDKYRTPERAMARHILLKTDDAKHNDAEIKAKIDGIEKQLRSGGDFAAIAKSVSEDTGSGAKGGDLGWVTHGQMVKPFEDAVFSQKPGVIGDPVKTQYGYHIIEVTQRESAHLRTFEEVKGELAAAYKQQRVNNLTQQLADKAMGDLRHDSAHPEKAAAAVNLPLQHAENVLPGDPLPQIGVAKEFDQATAGLNKNDVTQPIVIGGNRIVVAVVTNVIPAHPASLDEARPQVVKALQSESLEVLVSQKASDLLAKTKELKGDLKKAAASLGLEMKTSNEVDRAGQIEGIGSSTTLPDLFSKSVGDIIGPQTIEGNRVIAKVVSKSAADLSGLASQSAALRDEIKSKRARERNMMFEEGVRQKLTQEGKIKIHQDVIDRVVSAYRS